MTWPSPPTWRHCKPCAVKWRSEEPCFSCGADVDPTAQAVPLIISGLTWVAGFAKGAGPV